MRTPLLSTLLLLGLASTALADATLEGTVTNLIGKPVPQARIHIVSDRDDRVVTTDDKGHYEAVVGGDQDVSIVVSSGNVQTFRRSHLVDGAVQRLDFALEVADGEIIHIVDDKPTVPPKLVVTGPVRKTPPYSPQAIERDAWAKAWLLLDVSETGKVLRVKLVKRPGFDLDEIAVKEAMKLQFAPALDRQGRPMRTTMFWAIEWPAQGWLRDHFGIGLQLPGDSSSIQLTPDAAAAPTIRPVTAFGGFGSVSGHQASGAMAKDPRLSGVRCAGTGPLNLDVAGTPTYRDCSRPNEKKLPYLPWLDGTQPIPPDPPEIAEKPEPPLQLTRLSYIPQITASAVTATLLAGWIYSYVEYSKYEARVVKFHASHNNESLFGPSRSDPDDLARYSSDLDGWHRWQKITIVAGIAVVGSTGVAALLWFRHQRKADFSVQPENSGASVTLSGHF